MSLGSPIKTLALMRSLFFPLYAQAGWHGAPSRRLRNLYSTEGRYLRVITLEDKVTIHNAFPDRRFKP